MQIAFPIYPGLAVLDSVGPYEVLEQVPGLDPVFVGAVRGPVRSNQGALGIIADATFDEVTTPAVVVVPGGTAGAVEAQFDGPLEEWLRSAHPGTRLTTSVCTGAIILAHTGLLTGLKATTHWMAMEWLAELGAVPTKRRVVEKLDQRIVTSAGVSSGIDMALRLVEILVDDVAAQAAQLLVEYDPQPPFHAGNPDNASKEVHARAQEYLSAPVPL